MHSHESLSQNLFDVVSASDRSINHHIVHQGLPLRQRCTAKNDGQPLDRGHSVSQVDVTDDMSSAWSVAYFNVRRNRDDCISPEYSRKLPTQTLYNTLASNLSESGPLIMVSPQCPQFIFLRLVDLVEE